MDTTPILERRTGKSFRIALAALSALSLGRSLVVVCNTQSHAESLCYAAHKMLESYGVTNDPAYMRSRDTIRLYNGKVSFVNLSYAASPSFKGHKEIMRDF